MTTTTATVETLTAEVRVLMVGSRQVTLSVAKQLDFQRLERLDVFGRVKIGLRNQYGELPLTVIGRSKITGVLALAVVKNHDDLSRICGCTTANGSPVTDAHTFLSHPEIVEAHRLAARAPLIVLAGLR